MGHWEMTHLAQTMPIREAPNYMHTSRPCQASVRLLEQKTQQDQLPIGMEKRVYTCVVQQDTADVLPAMDSNLPPHQPRPPRQPADLLPTMDCSPDQTRGWNSPPTPQVETTGSEPWDARDLALLQRLSTAPVGEGPRTTLMIRNIPVMYTQEMLLMEWPYQDTFNFLYLPYDYPRRRNLSYCFVNFETEAAAVEFTDRWQKKRLAHFSSRKPLNISFADVQGRYANILQLKKKRVQRVKAMQCQPVLFHKGVRIGLEEALQHEVIFADEMSFTVFSL